jgi:cytochrome c
MTMFSIRLGIAALAVAPLFVSVSVTAQSASGEQLFKQRCQVCHAVKEGSPDIIAPNLAGVVGRKAGLTKFNYSPALKASKITWTKATLDKFLTGPSKYVPGTRMVVGVADPAQRQAVITYLATIKQ